MLSLLFSNWISWRIHLGIAWLDGRNLDLSVVIGRVVGLISVPSVQIFRTSLNRAGGMIIGEMRGGGAKVVARYTDPLDSLVIRFSPHYLPHYLSRPERMIYPNIIHPKQHIIDSQE